MIKVANCACTLDEALEIPYGTASDDAVLCAIAARALGVDAGEVESAEVLRRSVDARKKRNVHFVLTLAVSLRDEGRQRILVDQGKAIDYRPYEPLPIEPVGGVLPDDGRPLVVGLGPAGLFAALYLAKAGLCPLVVERGADVRTRQAAVRAFNEGGPLDLQTNIQFGEGGAGTFSDGKLTTGTKHPFAEDVLHWFVKAGAPRQILWDAKPHIGSDVLPGVVESLREQIVRHGGEVRFQTKLADVTIEGGKLVSARLEGPCGSEEIAVTTLVLACGHSARDTFEMLHGHGLCMEQKPFSVGVRIEHRQSDIDAAQFGDAAGHPALGPAEYKMAVHVSEQRSAYTFCMCPGGEVVCASSEEGGICTNGMSNLARDGENANAALLVNVDPADFPTDDPLAGVRLQREIERRAFDAARKAGGAPYQAPCQRVGDFLKRRSTIAPGTVCVPTYARGTVECDLREVLPGFVSDTLEQALPMLDRKLRGFAAGDALMTAPETRSSSPVRICRDAGYQALIAGFTPTEGEGPGRGHEGSGIYLCGEGPGYAGGIMSAAADGMRVAQQVVADARSRAVAHTFANAASALRAGGAVVFPTDTVAGLGVSVRHASGPQGIFHIKRRPQEKPVAWLVGGVDALREFGRDVPAGVVELAREFWPGPLTVIVRASDAVPAAYRSQTGTIGLRMPACESALELIAAVGGPLATSSANLAGEPASSTPEGVSAQVREAAAAVLADGGRPSGLASTVLDCSGEVPLILREGAVTREQIARYLPAVEGRA